MRMKWIGGALLIAAAALPAHHSRASSHREAPFITEMPKVDGTDFYMFRSYEGIAANGTGGRSAYVTFIANYIPLQSEYGGPNFFNMDPDAIYEIHIDNGSPADPAMADGIEDITFQFDFDTVLAAGGNGFALDVGPAGNTKSIAIPLVQKGGISSTTLTDADQNVLETYTVNVIRGPRRSGTVAAVTKAGGGARFEKPLDNIGNKTIPNYTAYANQFVFDIDIPGCTPPAGETGRVFVGQRDEGFAVNLGQIFDLVNVCAGGPGGPVPCDGSVADVIGAQNQGFNVVRGNNVTSIAIEVPASCLLSAPANTSIGGWTTASVRQARVINPTGTFDQPSREGGPWVQVSRLGNPLVNEVVIGLPDKNKFNNSEPKDDGTNFADYVTHPTLPELLELLFSAAVPSVQAPNNFPRTDLLEAFVTGLPGATENGSVAEMVRLNTALPGTPRAGQADYGAALCVVPSATGYTLMPANDGCDLGGFPNGRRPGDDVVDVAIRVAMGYIAGTDNAPAALIPFVDGAGWAGGTGPDGVGPGGDAATFKAGFPYLNDPNPGSP
jgi:hypothetical protein